MSAVLRDKRLLLPMGITQLDAVLEIERQAYEFPWTHGNFIDSLAAGYVARVIYGRLAGAMPGAAPSPAVRGAAHVCLETDDIEHAWAALMKAGATAQGAISTVTTGAVGGAKAGYIRDPNGILIELLQLAAA